MVDASFEILHAGIGGFGKFVVSVAGQQFVGVFQIVLEEGQAIGPLFRQLERLRQILARLGVMGIGVAQLTFAGSTPVISIRLPTGLSPK